MKRKLTLFFVIATGMLLIFTVVQAARQPAPAGGEGASMAAVGGNSSPGLNTLQATNVVSTTFTYQGLLDDGGNPANGAYDFEFLLFDDPAAGSQVGMTVALDDVTVADGLVNVGLNFGDVFDGRGTTPAASLPSAPVRN